MAIKFFTAFWRYVWYRSGPTIAWSTGVLFASLAMLAIYPNMPLAANVIIAFLGLLILIGLMDVLTLADRVESGQSVYPKQLFLLPQSAASLATSPLAGSAALMALLGIELGYGACARLTGYAQAWWAVPFLAGSMCMFSAIAWRSYPHSTMRLLFSLVGVTALLAGPVLLVTDLARPWQVGLGYLATIPFSVASAIHSVGLARRGEAARPWKFNDRIRVRPAFRSPMEAQVWLELKRNGVFATAMLTILITTLGGVAMITIRFTDQTWTLNGVQISSPGVNIPAVIVGGSLLLLGLSGCCASPADNLATSSELQPFLALRPMSTAQLVEAKMRMAAILLLRCSVISLVAAFCLLLVPSQANPGSQTTLFTLAHVLTWQQGAAVGVLYCTQLLGAWKGMVSGIWCGIGRLSPFVRTALIALAPLMFTLAVLGVPAYLISNPQYLPRALAALPYVAGAFVLLKLALAAYAADRLRQLALVPDRTIVLWVVVWLAVALVLTCALSPFRSLVGLSLAAIVFGQFLTLPFGRLALAPTLVSANRHR